MSTGVFCGVPFFFRKKASRCKGKARKNVKKMKVSRVESPSQVAGSFVSITELRNKISTLRDLLDFSPYVGSASIDEVLMLTLNDLFKRYPKIKPVSEFKGASLHKALKILCDALKSLGDLWTTEKWMVGCKYDSSKRLGHVELEQTAMAMLEDIVKLARGRLFDEMDDDEDMRDYSLPASAFGKVLSESSSENRTSFSDSRMSFSGSPETPTSVLEKSWRSSSSREGYYSPPLLLSLRVQAVGKLNPIDVKRLSFHMFPHAVSLAQDPKYAILMSNTEREEERESEAKQLSEAGPSDVDKENRDGEMMDQMEINNVVNRDSETESDSPKIARTGSVGENYNTGRNSIDIQPQPTPEASTDQEMDVLLSPPSPSELASNVAEQVELLLPSQLASPPLTIEDGLLSVPFPPNPPPPPPPPPIKPRSLADAPSLPPTPPPSPRAVTSGNIAYPPAPPPPPRALMNCAPPPPPPPIGTSNGNGEAPPPPPPPMGASRGNGAAPPPPPGVPYLRPKKLATKLKRSSQIGNLYRVLKGKVEGSSLEGRSSGLKGKIGGAACGKQGMADALAEITRRSAYFQQIEEDVKTYAGVIKEVKSAISSFQTSDMTELLNFHKYVENHLEKLTDETQVLARFEDFPSKKLEALRMAAALYSKLHTIVITLEKWPIVAPVGQLLEKVEHYFNKIKVEMDALERTKDEEVKRFQAQNITFDFGILLRIKELMVDVSSNCMELALQEKREGRAEEEREEKPQGKKKGSAKLLWRAFQFAFRVYTFAGGHDERADKLTRELAHEIETDH